MSRVTLPPGKKPLATIRRVRDAVDRVEDYGKLLEWLLVAHFPKPQIEKEYVFLGDYVQHHADKFSDIADVKFALGVYNDIKHTNTKRDRPPEPDEIERAAEHLDLAVFELLLLVPWPVRRAVLVDPYVQLAKKWAIAAAIGIALWWLIGNVVPAYFNRHRTAQEDGPSHGQYEFAQQQRANLERSARETLASIEQLELALAKWRRRWDELSSGADGRRLAGSADAVKTLAAFHRRSRPQPDDIKKLRSEVEDAMKPLRHAKAEAGYSQTQLDSATHRVGQIRQHVLDEAAACNSALDTVTQLLAQSASAEAAELSLEQAIGVLEEGERLAKVEAERKAAEEVVRLKAEKAKLVEARRQDWQKKLAADQTEYRRLRSLAEAPEIREKFQPFLGQGVRFPRVNRRSVSWQNEAGRQPGPPRPIGYVWLKSVGVFDSADAMIAVATSTGNDRGPWSAATTEAELKEYQDRFATLKELAPVWHDMGLLGPRPERAHHPDPDELASRLSAFEGQWRAVKYDYDIVLIGDVAVTIRSDNPKNPVGADMLRIERVIDKQFSGSHYFQDGNWRAVVGELINPNQMQLISDGYSWVMERIPTGPVP